MWAHSLAGVTGQLASDDPQMRTLLQTGPGFADEASRLLDQIKPTLPVLLANLTTIGQIGVTYRPHWSSSWSCCRPRRRPCSRRPDQQPHRLPVGRLHLDLRRTRRRARSDSCRRRSGGHPPTTSDIDTPDGLYCKLPQDSPIAVRGARNYPCMGHPGSARRPCRSVTATSLCATGDAPARDGPYPLDPI